MNPLTRGSSRSSRRNISSLQRKAPALSENCAGTPTVSLAANISRSGSVAKYAAGALSITVASINCTPALSAMRASRKFTAMRSKQSRSAIALSPSATTASGAISSSSAAMAAHALPASTPVTTGSVTYAREPNAQGISRSARRIAIVGFTGLAPNGSNAVTRMIGRARVIELISGRFTRRCPRPTGRASRASCAPSAQRSADHQRQPARHRWRASSPPRP